MTERSTSTFENISPKVDSSNVWAFKVHSSHLSSQENKLPPSRLDFETEEGENSSPLYRKVAKETDSLEKETTKETISNPINLSKFHDEPTIPSSLHIIADVCLLGWLLDWSRNFSFLTTFCLVFLLSAIFSLLGYFRRTTDKVKQQAFTFRNLVIS